MNILIIDDNTQMAELLCHIAQDKGYEATIAINADDILTKYFSFKPDVIFLDIFMPEIDGFEVLKLLKSHNCKSQIVVLSGDDEFCLMAHDMAHVLGLNIFDAIHKPFRKKQMNCLLDDLEKYLLLTTVDSKKETVGLS